jgi:hypothetical protein
MKANRPQANTLPRVMTPTPNNSNPATAIPIAACGKSALIGISGQW